MKTYLYVFASIALVWGGVLFISQLQAQTTATSSNMVMFSNNVFDASTATNRVGSTSPESILRFIKSYGNTTEFINLLCSSGEFCKVKGHRWEAGRNGEGNGVYFADYHPNVEYRHCVLCGAGQSQMLENWK